MYTSAAFADLDCCGKGKRALRKMGLWASDRAWTFSPGYRPSRTHMTGGIAPARTARRLRGVREPDGTASRLPLLDDQFSNPALWEHGRPRDKARVSAGGFSSASPSGRPGTALPGFSRFFGLLYLTGGFSGES